MNQGECLPVVDVTHFLQDLDMYGVHKTDAHARLMEQAIQSRRPAYSVHLLAL